MNKLNCNDVALVDLPLPDAFLEFLRTNEIDPSIYSASTAATIPRYIRLKPGCECHLMDIESELQCKIKRVDWLPGFFAIPPHIQIASSKVYKSGKIYGMDAASGAAILALNILPGDHVLDLCAAPGAKLCMISDLLGSSGTLTGVDIAKHRLAACRTMLQKYELGHYCRLFVADGTTFALLPLRSDAYKLNTDYREGTNDMYKEWSSKRLWRDRKEARKLKNAIGPLSVVEKVEPELIYYGKESGVINLHRHELFRTVDETEYSVSGYDKVLVDAECTHDGSFKHIQKFEQWGWETLQRRVLDAKRSDDLMQLQLKLLSNGFRLLKVGGSLVYSTCSLTISQNEDVVEQFLAKTPSAVLEAIDSASNWPCRSGKIPKTLRFDPKTSQTSGLFVAKLKKLSV